METISKQSYFSIVGRHNFPNKIKKGVAKCIFLPKIELVKIEQIIDTRGEHPLQGG